MSTGTIEKKPVKTTEELRETSLSDVVSYWTAKDQRSSKKAPGILASGRWFVGVRYKERFHFGILKNNRFIPGITWCSRFIPGLMTRRGFFPGLTVKGKFTSGIIAGGVFMPGVVHGGNFVPGIMRGGQFIPGCFDASRAFIPGRFRRRGFESGLMKNDAFLPTPYETYREADLAAIAREGYGLKSLGKTSPVGGLLVRGAVAGPFADAVAYLPFGLATTAGVLIGGLGPKDDLVALDPVQELGDHGFDVEDPNDLGNLLGTDGTVEKIEKSLDDMLPGGALGGNSSSPMGNLAEAMEGMSQGENRLLDDLNDGWADYWNSMLGSTGGLIAGASDRSRLGKAAGIMAVGVSGMLAGMKAGMAAGGAVAGPFGAAVGGFLGAVGGMPAGEDGTTIGGEVVGFIVGAVMYVWQAIFGSSDKKKEDEKKQEEKEKGKGTSQPGEDGGEDTGGALVFGRPKPIGPYISHRKAVIEIDHGESGAISTIKTERAPIRIIITDTGAMSVVDYGALRRTIITSPETGVAVGLNALTGETVYIPGKVDWSAAYEQSKMPWWLDKVGHPLEE